MRVSGDPEAANNGLFYIHYDHFGSTSALTKYSDGTIVNSSLTRYTPFGGYRSGGPSQITDRAFTGQKENMALGLYYYNARYYAPSLGRFLSADTIVRDPQNPQSLNRYAYALNSPLNYTDPSGHCINGGDNGASGSTGIDDPYYDCSNTPPPSTNPTGETMNVQGLLRILAMLEGTEYADMDIYEASLWWNAIYVRLNPLAKPVNDENGGFLYPGFHEDQIAALRKAYNPGQLESMAKEPRNNDLSQFELGRAKGVEIPYLNTVLGIQGGPQYSTFILRELGLGFDPNEYASNFEPNYLNALYAYQPDAVNSVIRRDLIVQLDIGVTPAMYRDVTNKPSDLFSTEP